MPEMIARVAQVYAGRELKPGDRFDVDPKHVRTLLALSRVEDPMTSGRYHTTHIASSPRKKRNRVAIVGESRKAR